RLTIRFHGQTAYGVRFFEALPVALVRHLFVRRAEDRVAQLGGVERLLRNACQRSVRRDCSRAGNTFERLSAAQTARELEQGTLAFAEDDEVERCEREHRLRRERRFHSAGHEQRTRRGLARLMCE